MMVDVETLKLLVICAFYVSANFSLLVLPLVGIGAFYYGWCRVALTIMVLDYIVFPLRPGPQGYWQAFSDLCNVEKGIRSYNRAKIIVEGGNCIKRNKNYCLCYLPHSLYPYAFWMIRQYFCDTYGIHVLYTGVDLIFHVPLLRRIHTWWGCTRVSYQPLKQNLQLAFPYNVIMLQPDGIPGMFYGIEHEQIVLQRRRGFCRIALQTGASLIPCYVLGINQLYNRKWGPHSKACRLSSKLRASLVYWTGRFGMPFGFIPNNCKLVVLIGPPIDVESKIDEPTKEQIDALHAKFVNSIKTLYDRHKHEMGDEWVKNHPKLYLETEHPPVNHRHSSKDAEKKKIDVRGKKPA